MKCERPSCRCEEAPVIRDGRNFCSEECADRELAEKGQTDCFCGHPDCAAA